MKKPLIGVLEINKLFDLFVKQIYDKFWLSFIGVDMLYRLKHAKFISIVACVFCFLWGNDASACPKGHYRDGLFGTCLPKLGGTVGQGAERLKNEIRGQSIGRALEVWLRQS